MRSNSDTNGHSDIPNEEMKHKEALSLFIEATEMTLVSASVFLVSGLRQLAIKSKTLTSEEKDQLLALPIDGRTVHQLSNTYSSHLTKRYGKTFFGDMDAWGIIGQNPERLAKYIVHHIGDENFEKECVHYVSVTHNRQGIYCVFRGSVTMQDWMEDAKLMITQVPNPLESEVDQSETVGIHLGFRNYIYGSNASSMGPDTQGDGPSRIDVVLEQLRTLKKQYPSYSIHVTGHSLGGALALIASLSIASDPILNELHTGQTPPCTCIAVANPKPGNGDFCRAMEALERSERLRCCVIHNTIDIVPMMGPNVRKLDNGFWHPGWRLLLYRHKCEWGRSQAPEPAHESVRTAEPEARSKNRGSSSSWRTSNRPRLIHGLFQGILNVTSRTRSGGTADSGSRSEDDDDEDATLTNEHDESESKLHWSLPARLPSLTSAKILLKKPRVNQHDHRLYLDRIVCQKATMQDIYLNALYEEWLAFDPNDPPLMRKPPPS